MKFKVISLKQPWAYLYAMGYKGIETRSWKTEYRGDLLVHASKSVPSKKAIKAFGENEYFHKYVPDIEALDYGAIIGIVRVNDIQTTATIKQNISQYIPDEKRQEQELTFGDYGDKRYGWLSDCAAKFLAPLPAEGSLHLWDFDMPDFGGGQRVLVKKEVAATTKDVYGTIIGYPDNFSSIIIKPYDSESNVLSVAPGDYEILSPVRGQKPSLFL